MDYLRKYWDKFTEWWRAGKGSFSRFAVLVTVIFGFLVLIVREDNVFRWIEAGLEIRSQNKQIKWYNKEIDRLDQEIDMLRTNRDSLEKFAREEFLFAAPGEDVYIEE